MPIGGIGFCISFIYNKEGPVAQGPKLYFICLTVCPYVLHLFSTTIATNKIAEKQV